MPHSIYGRSYLDGRLYKTCVYGYRGPVIGMAFKNNVTCGLASCKAGTWINVQGTSSSSIFMTPHHRYASCVRYTYVWLT